MDFDLIPGFIIVLAGLGVLLLLTVSLSKMRAKQIIQHENNLQKFAKNARMRFHDFSPELEQTLSPFEMIQKPRIEVQIKNVLFSRSGELALSLFEYSWKTSAQDEERQKQTAILFDDYRLKLAHFSLRPRKMGNFEESFSGSPDIVPERSPEFKKKFRLVGESPVKTHQLLTDELAEYFLQNQNLCAEGIGNLFLIYEPGRLIAPSDLQDFLELHLTGYHLLKQAASRSQQTGIPN